MSDQPETATYYMNPFYDSVFATLNTRIPSKWVRYHINEQNQTVTLHERESGKQFAYEDDAQIVALFVHKQPGESTVSTSASGASRRRT